MASSSQKTQVIRQSWGLEPADCSREMSCSSKTKGHLMRVQSSMCTHGAALLHASFLASFDAGLQQVKSFALLADACVQVLERDAMV